MKMHPDEAIAEVRAARKALCDRFGNLSEVLHHGKEDAEAAKIFANVKSDVEKHFDALRVFNSISAK
jgi:hypothetical protein